MLERMEWLPLYEPVEPEVYAEFMYAVEELHAIPPHVQKTYAHADSVRTVLKSVGDPTIRLDDPQEELMRVRVVDSWRMQPGTLEPLSGATLLTIQHVFPGQSQGTGSEIVRHEEGSPGVSRRDLVLEDDKDLETESVSVFQRIQLGFDADGQTLASPLKCWNTGQTYREPDFTRFDYGLNLEKFLARWHMFDLDIRFTRPTDVVVHDIAAQVLAFVAREKVASPRRAEYAALRKAANMLDR